MQQPTRHKTQHNTMQSAGQMGYSIALSGCFGAVCTEHDIWLYGHVYLHQQKLSVSTLKAQLVTAIMANRLSECLQQLNGYFTVVLKHGSQLLCFTDKLRSRPLYYIYTPDCFYLSDQPASLAAEHGCQLAANPLVQHEFLHTGYVTGADTLLTNLKQLQAAELLQLNLASKQLHSQFYYCFIPCNTNLPQVDVASWQAQLEQVVTRVVDRLIHFAAGRQIVLPLSGGYDSRALALYLKKAAYPDVLCFTFGRKGSAEAKLSQRIAAELGFNWHCVSYSRTTWVNLQQDPQFKDYLSFVHGLVSVPNVQVFPAIQQLLARKLIKPDAVVAPGHTSAFFSGSLHASGAVQAESMLAHSDLVQVQQAVIAKHFQNSRAPISPQLQQKLAAQLAGIAGAAQLQGIANINSVAEAWNYRERQAKFIVNSNRYYDFFKLDWWMPFWDGDFMGFWQGAPYQLRRKKVLWVNFVEQAMQNYTGNSQPYGHASIKKYPWLTRLYSWFNYWLDDNHLFALVPFSRWLCFKLRLTKRSGNVFGVLSEYCLTQCKSVFGIKSTNNQ